LNVLSNPLIEPGIPYTILITGCAKSSLLRPKRDRDSRSLASFSPARSALVLFVCVCVCSRRMKQNTEILCVTLKSIPHLQTDSNKNKASAATTTMSANHKVCCFSRWLFVFVFVFACVCACVCASLSSSASLADICVRLLLLPSAFSLLSAERNLLLPL